MSKYFQILLTAVYALLTASCFITLLKIWGVPVPRNVNIALLLGWTLYCFSSAYFRTRIVLAGMQVRKPVKEEEDNLGRLFQDVLQQAGNSKKYQLLVQEEMGCNAFAIGVHTIVVSRGLFNSFDPLEIKAVMAHELGHLKSRDCMMSSAFVAASFLPSFVITIYEKGKGVLLRLLLVSYFFRIRHIFLSVLVVLPAWLYFRHLLLPVLATILFVYAYRKIIGWFVFFWRMISRFREYAQDAYAHQLGYGKGLRQALLKLTLNEAQSVSLYEILTRADHPVIYNRIRRLEKLTGLR